MVFIIFFSAVIIALFFCSVYDGDWILFFCGVVVSIFILSILLAIPPDEIPYQSPHEIEIVQLKHRESTSMQGGGSFLGWSMSSDQTAQYVIMTKDEKGRMIRAFLDQKTTYLVETDATPRVEWDTYTLEWPRWRCAPWKWKGDGMIHWKEKNGTIYVPKGTVALKIEEIR